MLNWRLPALLTLFAAVSCASPDVTAPVSPDPTASPIVSTPSRAPAGSAVLPSPPPAPVSLARNDLAADLSVPIDRVEIVEVVPATWPDNCLGIPAPELCRPGDTPGYSVVFRVYGKEYRYHTDTYESFRYAGPGDTPSR